MKKQVLFGLVAGIALMAGVSAASAQDAGEGEKVFRQCKACHSLDAGKKGVGPSLHGLIGRQSGTVEGFAYSPAMKAANITWTPENLSKYLADPKGFVAGNKMAFAGVKKEDDLKNLVAYLGEAAK
ncbi:cytochrome C [Skermanella stibiiresistens SB22]|uniref:Cytochrome C n=1 Tax=Skermanella stibiiresistens SB22 TaxID=1385369 RepID=W9H3K3_9PROT|nr:cytochrome c family protein [Skermanella stibiiresistens]EWY39307.1 cytochrome C [Skermanella stibiiresistens SB22]